MSGSFETEIRLRYPSKSQNENCCDGNGWFDTTELASALDVFEALYNDHIVLEESLAYPEASKRLAQTDTSGMGREMAARRARLKKES